VEHTEVARGDVVVPRELYRTTRAVDVRLNYLASAPRELRHRSTLRLHSATYEVSAQVILFDRDALQPGESALAQLRLARPVLLLPGDPFVLRTYSPSATLGGGTVLDPAPPRRRRRTTEAMELLTAIEEGEEGDRIGRMVAASLLSGLSYAELANRTGLSARRLDAALMPLLSSGAVIQVVREPRVFLGREAFAVLKGSVLAELDSYLQENAMKEGIGKEELKTRLPKRSDPRFFTPVLASLEKEGAVVADRDLVKLPGRKGTATAEQTGLREKIGSALLTGGSEPPTVKELCDLVQLPEKMLLEQLSTLVREGEVVRVKGDLYYAATPLAAIREKLFARLTDKGEITPNEFREITGLSRKFMIPLLEYFDSTKLTIRVGDKRILRK